MLTSALRKSRLAERIWEARYGIAVALLAVVLILPYIYFAIAGPLAGLEHPSALVTYNWVLGQDFTGPVPGHYRPPLIGVVLALLVPIFGIINSGEVFSCITYILFGLGAYRLSRVWLSPRDSFLAAVIVLICPVIFIRSALWYAPVLGVGLGLFLIPLFLQREKTFRTYIGAGILAFLIAGLNQTAPALFLVALLGFPVYKRDNIKLLLVSLGAAAFWAPFYISAFFFSIDGFFFPSRIAYYIFGIAGPWGFHFGGFYLLAFASLRRKSPFRTSLILSLILPLLAGLWPTFLIGNLGMKISLLGPVFFSLHILYTYSSSLQALRKAIRYLIPTVAILAFLGFAVTQVVFFSAAETIYEAEDWSVREWILANTEESDEILASSARSWRVGLSSGRATYIAGDLPELNPYYAESECLTLTQDCGLIEASVYEYIIDDQRETLTSPLFAPDLRYSELVARMGDIGIYKVGLLNKPTPLREGRVWPWELISKAMIN